MRREFEQCDRVEDIIIQSSQMGGTGSAAAKVFRRIMDEKFGKKVCVAKV